jgi:hypothetical protein
MFMGSALIAARLPRAAARCEALALSRIEALKIALRESSELSWLLLSAMDREAAQESCMARAMALALAWEGSDASSGWAAAVRRGDGPWGSALIDRSEHLADLAWRWDKLGLAADWRPKGWDKDAQSMQSFAEAYDAACEACSRELGTESKSSRAACLAREKFLAQLESFDIEEALALEADAGSQRKGLSKRL